MSLTQQDTDPRAIHQPAPAAHPAGMILTPIIALFVTGLRPLNFVISQGALAVAPLVALLGFDNAAERFSYLYADEHTDDRANDRVNDRANDRANDRVNVRANVRANKIDGNVALRLRSAQNQTRGR